MKEKNIIERLSRFAFVMSILGLCTVGICPAFGVMGIVVPAVLKAKKAPMEQETLSRNKKSVIAGVISLVFFIIDVVLLAVLSSEYGWFN